MQQSHSKPKDVPDVPTNFRMMARISPRCLVTLLASAVASMSAQVDSKSGSTSPQQYSVHRDDASGLLTLRTSFYTVEHDLRKGGAINRIALKHGKADNLLLRPVETRVRDGNGVVLSDLNDSAPKVTHRRDGLSEIVTVECALLDENGRTPRIRLKTTYQYRWGYLKIHKEFSAPSDRFRIRELCAFSTILSPGLTDYGYREGTTEAEGAPPFSFGSNRWGKLRLREPSDGPLQTPYVPRSMIFVDPGVEGLEWFVGSDLAQWDLQLGGQRGQGQCALERSQDPPGLALSISPLRTTDPVALPRQSTFDFYLAIPLLEGPALQPWLHTSFNRNRGNWVSAEEIRRWAEKGIQTVHCHNDGDYYEDGLFWRDGSYPPYSDMERYDQVLQECRRVGIRTATYFSNKELHPSTKEFQEHGAVWGRKDRKGELRHNYLRGKSEFGAQMCLRSGWLEFLKLSIDRVLKNHPLDGVYFDWNVALFCSNPLHEGNKEPGAAAQGHWDIDELLELMEWTRNRVGPSGLVIVHNTTTPMFAMENFADYIVATEWGYKKWTDQSSSLEDLPLEWSLAGARARGVISYGTIDSKAPRRLHRVFALEAFLGGVTPWPASPETFDLLPLFKPLGAMETYRFADWRNQAVSLSDKRCASAIYSRADEAYLLLANLDSVAREVTCVLHPEKLPHPLDRLHAATQLATGSTADANPVQQTGSKLDVGRLVGEGVRITIPADNAILIQIKGL